MADAYYELGEYEDAADHAFTSIELVKYFPAAHYILGKSLEKLGDLENAKIAYATANKLRPKEFHRAAKAVENVEKKMNVPAELRDKINFGHQKNQIVVVSGLPRSGTSVMMQMLDKGGTKVLVDGKRKADESNPKGYLEYEPVMRLHKDNSWLGEAQNKTVKIVAPLLGYLDPKYRYKIIFMKRDIDEVVKSQRKMVGKNPDIIPLKLHNAFVTQLKNVESWKDKEPGVELIYVDYKDVLEKPEEIAGKVEEFIGVDLDTKAMASCVDTSLYRNRKKTIKT